MIRFTSYWSLLYAHQEWNRDLSINSWTRQFVNCQTWLPLCLTDFAQAKPDFGCSTIDARRALFGNTISYNDKRASLFSRYDGCQY